MKIFLFVLSLVLFSAAVSAGCPLDADGKARISYEAKDAPRDHVVPFARLLARPESFDGKRILLFGVLAQDGAGFSLYSDSEAMKYKIFPSAIFLELTNDLKLIACRSNGSYVLIQGTFSPYLRETIVTHSGSLKAVTRMWPLSAREAKATN